MMIKYYKYTGCIGLKSLYNGRGVIRRVLFFLMCMVAFSAWAQSVTTLKAVNDTIRTGPLQSLQKNIIDNDTIPGDNYGWRMLTVLPASVGTISVSGDYFTFLPAITCRDTAFDVFYELWGSNAIDTATIHIIVTRYNNPVNIISPDVTCYEEMPQVTFGIREKYKISPRAGSGDWIDAFTSPLVGDLNGDGKPEIVVMGNYASSGGGAMTTLNYINIYNGQTGERMGHYDFTNLGTGYSAMTMGDDYHRAPSILALADLDNDDTVEIVMCHAESGRVAAFKPHFNASSFTFTLTRMWEGHTGTNTTVSYKQPLSGSYTLFGYPHPYIADLNGDGIPEVIVHNKIYNGKTGSLLMAWQDAASLAKFSNYTVSTGLADEFYANPVSSSNANSIKGAAMIGARRPSNAVYSDKYLAVPVIVDIDGDGQQEIITGNRIHKFNFNSLTDHTKNTYTTIEGPQSVTVTEAGGSATYYLNDGFTRVADIDGDGVLDIIVACNGNDGAYDTKIIVYVWNMNDLNNVKACLSFRSDVFYGNFSIPFIGDINGKLDGGYDGQKWTKKLPEICILGGYAYINRASDNDNRTGIKFHPKTDALIRQGVGWDNNNTSASNRRFNRTELWGGYYGGHIIGLTWDDTASVIEEKLKLSWAMEHRDQSNNTGITLFDFDNNNTADLCYRDERTLRVISPAKSGNDYVDRDEDENSSSIMFRTSVSSGTAFEYPVIADVNMDGSADIVVTDIGSWSTSQSRGWINVYEYSGSRWSPCPPVWNQGMYDPTQVREDLKINARPLPMLTKFKKKNGDSIQPYNGSWMQVPIVKEGDDYVPVVRQPDADILNMEVSVALNSATIKLTIRNRGSASINSQTPIAFYDGGTAGLPIGSSMLIGSARQVGVDIFPEEKLTLTYTLTGDFNDKLIWARIMDDGTNFPATGYLDCDLSNNTFSGIDCPYLRYTIAAVPDTVLCGTEDNVTIAVIPNVPARFPPTYQWYRNDVLIPGATDSSYLATMAGEYKCYITENVCRGFSSVKILTRNVPIAIDDHFNVSSGMEIVMDVLRNDNKSNYCSPVPVITEDPENGTALVVFGNKISYQSNFNFSGKDTLTYQIGNSEAKVYISINKFPNNVLPDEVDCNAEHPPFSFEMKTAWVSEYAYDYHPLTYSTPLTGDIDGDGKTEVLALGVTNGSTALKLINVFEGSTGEPAGQIRFPQTLSLNGNDILILDGDKDGKGEVLVVFPNENKIFLFEVSSAPGERPITFDTVWVQSVIWSNNTSIPTYAPITPIVADFDGDGKVEFVAGNRLIAYNGNVLDTLPYRNILTAAIAPGVIMSYRSYAADVDGDGHPEIINGSDVYKWNGTDTVLYARCPDFPNGKDGWNMSGDINMDGNIDLVFFHERGEYIIWTPALGTVIGRINIASYPTGYPFVGDIDGEEDIITRKKYPEICFTVKESGNDFYLYAYTYTGSALKEKWKLHHSLPLNNNNNPLPGIAMFDFNTDGILEIVTREQHNIRIIDGSGSTPVVLDTIPCEVWGYSSFETPVIADVNGDGSADIIVTGPIIGSDLHEGRVMVIEGKKSKWASCPNVWNQQMYSPLWVNRDLTIPATVSLQNLKLPCGDTVLYYNGGVIQAPYISETTFCPIDISSDVYVVGGDIFTSGNDVTFNITFGNQGQAVARKSIPIRYYVNAIDGANIIDSAILGVDLYPGKDTTISKKIDVSSIIGTNSGKYYVRILDDGTHFPAYGPYSDCNLTNNQKSFGTVELSKTINSNHACTNGTSIFTITLINNSDLTSNHIVLVDSLGDGWEYSSTSASMGNVGQYDNNHKIKWTLDSLSSKDTAVWFVIARTPEAGMMYNYAWIDSVNGTAIGKELVESYVTVSNSVAPLAATITPNDPVICKGDSVALSASVSGASDYTWYWNYVELTDDALEVCWAKEVGNYVMTYFDGTCISELSNLVTVTLADTVKGGTIGYSQSVVTGFSPALLVSLESASGGLGGHAYQWQKKEGNGVWENIPLATDPAYHPATPTAFLTDYRRMVITDCDTAYSNTITIQANDYPDNISEADCFVDPPETPWTIKQLTQSKTYVNNYLIPMVGDIDNDGKVEIVAGKDVGSMSTLGGDHNSDTLTIFEMVDDSLVIQQNLYLGAFINNIGSNMGIANVDGGDYAAIFVATSSVGKAKDTDDPQATDLQRKLVKYTYDGTKYVLHKPIKDCPEYSNEFLRDAAQPMFADFNGDSIPEVVVLDKVYNARTLELLADGGILANTHPTANYQYGLGYGGHINNNHIVYGGYRTSHMAIADMDNDGLPELVAGHCVYKIDIQDIHSSTTGNTFTLWSKCDSIGPDGSIHTEVRDGPTSVADMDGDGFLDVIVTGIVKSSSSSVFVWNPRTKHVMHNTAWTTSTSSGPSRALVGDVDGDKSPEIVFLTASSQGTLHCIEFDGSDKTLTQKWSFNNSDNSGATTLTLFDFNNDGSAELVYRDQDSLYIINGADGKSITSIGDLKNATANEYPLIVDVNNDKRAEIVVVGFGRLQIFSSNPSGNWATARPVWNQVPYNVVNVNEDLTIPAVQMNPAMVFPGKDQIIGTSDDIRPYNNFLQQQTALNKYGVPLWLTPDAQFTETPVPYFNHDAGGDSLVITLYIANTGDAALQTPLYVSAYRNELDVANWVATDSAMEVVNVGDTLLFHLTIRNLSSLGEVTEMVIRVNDKGAATFIQSECDTGNNTLLSPYSAWILAENDTATTISTAPVKIAILDNDILGDCITPVVEVVREPAHGSESMNNNKDTLTYIPNATFTGVDTITYRIACNKDTTTANVYVIVLRPLSLNYIACPGTVVTMGMGFDSIPGVKYWWYDSVTAGNTIRPLPSDTIVETKDGSNVQIYWAEPRLDNLTFLRYPVYLRLADNCGTTTPTGCGATGTVIYREDFGGNELSDSTYKQQGLSQMDILYTYDNIRIPENNNSPSLDPQEYLIGKIGEPHSNVWEKIFDHTHPTTDERGYFMEVNSSSEKGQFYSCQIDGLCAGLTLYFSAWINNVLNLPYGHPDHVNQIFILEDLSGNRIAQYYTGDILNGNPQWRQYGFQFTMPENLSSIRLRIINNGTGSLGNDFGLDDIEVRLCYPAVTLIAPTSKDTTLCNGSSLNFEGTYTDSDGSFTNNGAKLYCRWEHNATEDINNPAAWHTVANTEDSSISNTITSSYTLNNVSSTTAGYYRLAVANAGYINSYNCRAMSDIVHVRLGKDVVSGTVSGTQTICYNATPTKLTSTAATGGSESLSYQWQESTDNGGTWTNVLSGGTLTDYDPPALTQTTQYRLITTGGTVSCEIDTSEAVTVTVYDSLKGGSIGTSKSTCYGIDPLIHFGFAPATGGSGSSNYTYQWHSSTDSGVSWNLLGIGAQEYDSNDPLTKTTRYFRQVTDSHCGTAYSDTIEVTVIPLPVVSIGKTELCPQLTTQLTPATDGNGYWTSSDSSKVDFYNSYTAIGKSVGSATLTYTSSTGCSNGFTVEVKAYPAVEETTGKHVICIGTSTQLTNNTAAGGVWTTNNKFITLENHDVHTVTAKGVELGKTFVTYTVSNGVCQSTKTFSIKIIPDTPPKVIIGFQR